MSYKVLARKWRPQHFRDMLGQEPVLRALINALDTDRLHHAYLFTGMRGVGKTTIARIFAKCLNCETNGVSASPCGECSACRDIEAGRFFDLIEVDAASRTKVEETRELLENVPYAPASGRYKVYLIDEVHMFSNHSFNALLKTLEEPPEHVKFLLATTDPQKVPVTVLSRCLQFNLKRMAPGMLADYLARILDEESIAHERPALDIIARASEGSVRDSLSLVEQAAAFGEGAVREKDVEAMLGRASVDRLLGLIEALGQGDLASLFEQVETLAEYAPDFAELTGEILSLLHRIALLQSVPGSVADNTPGFERLTRLASEIDADEIQLFYQIGTHARRDMPFAPDPREAFDMALLRMNAFRPQPSFQRDVPNDGAADKGLGEAVGKASAKTSGKATGKATGEATGKATDRATGKASGQHESPSQAQAAQRRLAGANSGKEAEQDASAPNATTAPTAPTAPTLAVRGAVSAGGSLRAEALAAARGEPAPTEPAAPETPVLAGSSTLNPDELQPDHWHQLLSELDLSGMPKQLAGHCELASFDAEHVALRLEAASEHLHTPRFVERLQTALGQWAGRPLRLTIELVDSQLHTPARIDEQVRSDAMAAARVSIGEDPVVRQLIERVDGAVDEASITPLGES